MSYASAFEILPSLHWVGVRDAPLRTFDIVMTTPYGTSYNSYLLTCGGKNVLFETAKATHTEEFLKHIHQALPEGEGIDFIVLNHTEPDHSGSLSVLLEKFPDAGVIATTPAISFLEQMLNSATFSLADAHKTVEEFLEGVAHPSEKTQILAVGPDDVPELVVGGHVLQFLPAPNLHWPDSMFTHIRDMDTLITCDVFGQHFCPPPPVTAVEDPTKCLTFVDAFAYYYAAIFSPFPEDVLYGLNMIEKHCPAVTCVCCSHGIPLKGPTVGWAMEFYGEKATEAIEAKKVRPARKEGVPATPFTHQKPAQITVVTASAYGYSRELVGAAAKAMEAENVVVSVHDVTAIKKESPPADSVEEGAAFARAAEEADAKQMARIIEDVQQSSALVLGTTTINRATVPPIARIIDSLSPLEHGNLVCGVAGSRGWSGEGIPMVESRLENLGFDLPLVPLATRFRPSKADLAAAAEWGAAFAAYVTQGEVPEPLKRASLARTALGAGDKWAKYANHKIWRCVVCGEIVKTTGGSPSDSCPVCGATGDDVWEPVLEFSGKYSEFAGTLVVVGAGAAGVSAVRAARAQAPDAKIVLISDEAALPYNRTSLSRLVKCGSSSEITLHPSEWFREQRIELKLSTRVANVDHSAQKLLLEGGGTLDYDRLIIATGASPFVPPMLATESDRIVTLRSMEDAKALCAHFSRGHVRVVAFGGGLLNLELIPFIFSSPAAQDGGVDLTLLECAPMLLGRVDNDVASHLRKALDDSVPSSCSLTLLTGSKTTSVVVSEEAVHVNVTSGGRQHALTADVIVAGCGVRANSGLARTAGLDVNECGIAVGSDLRCMVNGEALSSVFAAGDVASVDGARPAGNWADAVSQGARAAEIAVNAEEVTQFPVSLTFLLHLGNTEYYNAWRRQPYAVTSTVKRTADTSAALLEFEGQKLVSCSVAGVTSESSPGAKLAALVREESSDPAAIMGALML